MGTPEKYPLVVTAALNKMDDTQRLTFTLAYKARKRTKWVLIILAILFPIQHFLLGKTGMGVAFWLTGFGFGVWWIIEILMTSGRVDEYNGQIATEIARDVALMT